MGNIVAREKKDQYIEDPEVIDGPDGHTPPGMFAGHCWHALSGSLLFFANKYRRHNSLKFSSYFINFLCDLYYIKKTEPWVDDFAKMALFFSCTLTICF